ncbi:MAG: TRAF-type zinc finger protein [Harvfovirus sp.]|uniref:TRAF-type zinc finger protein n=1 Tax=Harvfovirus sp. TaxID=2487768 RepID=A0A3G5A066_9VIRU|nr:MAG: TRAF-type zinc finger protein [Harvfovirus sp.]
MAAVVAVSEPVITDTGTDTKDDAIPLVTATSVSVSLFAEVVPKDYLCGICHRVPLKPVNPKCCGQISCKECIEFKVNANKICPYCKEACEMRKVPSSPFVATKLSGLEIDCPNSKMAISLSGDAKKAQCKKMNFGKEGMRLTEHMDVCPFVLIKCPDCDVFMIRLHFLMHRPEKGPCPHMPVTCSICDGVKIKRELWEAHQQEQGHVGRVNKRVGELAAKQSGMAAEIVALRKENEETKGELVTVRSQLRTATKECDEKIASAELRYEQKMQEVRAHSIAHFVEFEVPKWSEVKEAALFSTATPLKAWGHEWWLKVEKAEGRIGLYLCCGEDGPFPVSVDYQLMVRKRKDDLGVCSSVVFRTEFGKEKAWGLSKFTTMEALEKDGAYNRGEDRITFGCRIVPVKNLVWGGQTRSAAASAAAARRD